MQGALATPATTETPEGTAVGLLLGINKMRLLLDYVVVSLCRTECDTILRLDHKGPKIDLGCTHFRNRDTWKPEGDMANPRCHTTLCVGTVLGSRARPQSSPAAEEGPWDPAKVLLHTLWNCSSGSCLALSPHTHISSG